MNKKLIYAAGATLIIGTVWLVGAGGDSRKTEQPKATATDANKVTATQSAARESAHSTATQASPRRLRAPKPQQSAPSSASQEKTYSNPADNPESWSDFQAAIYAYKGETLVPKLKQCWGEVGGNASITAKHTYDVIDGIARPAMLEQEEGPALPDITFARIDGDISDEDLEIALTCLRAAAQETEFHYVGLDGETAANDTFAGFWGWDTRAAQREQQELAAHEQRRMN